MERGKDLWKRIASLVLSLALVLTLMPVQFAYAEEGDNVGGREEQLPDTLMYFSFDNDVTDGGKVKAEIVTQDDANVPVCDKSVKKVGDGALRLNSVTSGGIDKAKGAYLKVPAGALATRDAQGNIVKDEDGKAVGKTKLTVSYWSKVTPNTGWGTGWVYFASENDAPGEDLKYIGVFDRADKNASGGHFTVECFNGGRANTGKGADINATESGFTPTTDWKHVMVVMEDKALKLYINGDKKAEKTIGAGIPNLANSSFYIGYATYGEYYNGYIDDLTVYDGALTDEQAEMLGKRALVEDAIASGILENVDGTDYNMGIGDSMTLKPISTIPSAVKRQITYKSSNEAVATVDEDGVVKAVAAGTAKITTTLKYDGKPNNREINVNVKTAEQILTPVKTYTFEDAKGDGDLQGAKAISKGLVDYTGQVEYAAGKDGVGKAVRTKATIAEVEEDKDNNVAAQPAVPGYGIQLKEENLGSAYTVSAWIKPDNDKAFHANGPVLALGHGKDKDERWMAISGNNAGENNNARVWGNITGKGRFDNAQTGTEFSASGKKWSMLTMTQFGRNVSFYLNGRLYNSFKISDEIMNGNGQGIFLGANFWDSEFNGLYDDVKIYNSALNAEQVRNLYVQDADAESMGMLGNNESYDYIREDLTLPAKFPVIMNNDKVEFAGYDVTWATETPGKITADGKVNKDALDGSAATLKAVITDKVSGAAWNKSFTLGLAKPIAVKFVDEANKVVRTDTEYGKVGSKYTYEVTEKMFSTADAAYEYDEDGNQNVDFTVDVTAQGTPEITIKCKRLPVGSVDFSKLPQDVYMIEGNKAHLPLKVTGTVSADNGTAKQDAAQGKAGEESTDTIINVPILWDDYSKLAPGEHTIGGSAAGFKCSLKLHIFACDESVADMEANDSHQKTKFKKGYKGVIETEFDIVTTGDLNGDRVIQYFDAGVADNADTFSGAAVSTRFSKGKFFVNGGDGNGTGSDYPAEADRTVAHNGTGIYHVRTQIDTTDVSVTPATEEAAAVVNKNGTYRVWVTDPEGNTTEITNPQKASEFRKVVTGIIDKTSAARGKFKITNHKISWQSGYVNKKIEIYLGEAATAEKTVTEKLLPSALLGDQAETSYGFKPSSRYLKDDVTYILNMEKSSWYQGTTKITEAQAIEAAVADATVTYKAYYEAGITDFAGLQTAVDAANDLYAEADAAGIYTASSLEKLQAEITKAENLLKTQGTAAPAPAADVDQAIKDLTDLTEKGLELKGREEMDASMEAYYPLTADAKDATGNGFDGEVFGDISFNRSNGAVFPGSEIGLTNYVELPNDMDITDKMTFSFWTNTKNGGGNNVFGISSGESIATANHFSIYTSKGASLSANAGKTGYNGPVGIGDIEFAANEWHLVTCVVDGTNLIFYVDGVKKKEGTIGVALEEVWNAHSEERHIYVGNNVYVWNGNGAYDPDYKGSLKYLRIYNASLAAEQVKDIYDYEVDAQLAVAEADLADELLADAGTGADAGKYTMLITDETLALPGEGPQGETIRWTTEDTDSIDINDETGTAAVTLPATGTKNATLKASIRLNRKNKAVEILCTLRTLTAEAKAARTALQGALKEANKLAETDYTSASWASFKTIYDTAKAAYSSAGDNMAAQKTALENAMKTDGSGTLVPRGDKRALKALISRAKAAMKKANQADYDEAVWTALEDAIKAAEELSDDVSQAVVDEEKAKLQAKYDAFKPKTYDKAQAEALAADAKKLLEGKNEFEYDEKVWADLQKAIAAVEALTDKSTVAQTTTAYKNLKAALEAFQPRVIDNEAVEKLVSDAKKELESLNKADYVPSAWTAVEAALAEIEKLPADADEAAIKAAYGKLWNALHTLKESPFVAVEKVTLNKSTLTLAVKKAATLTATINPGNATDKKKVWSTSSSKIAAVDQNGKVTAKSKGTAIITVKAGGKTATCRVTVTVPVTKVKLSADYTSVAAGKKATVKAAITPNNASNKAVTWSISSKDKKYASVSKKGVVTTKRAGAGKTVTITATAKDGSKKKATIKIKIMKNAVTKVSLKAKAKKVKAGKKVTVKATVKTNGKKANKKLAWKTSNKKWATVNGKGVVTTKKAGKGKTVTITATSTDGTKKSAKVKIKITK